MDKNYHIVGTAGHIDHGKSALVRTLTGIDPDRLQEEQERGITIDIGFAHLELDGGTRVGFIDVPGHERFIKNMLAGVGGIDSVLLVVAADESIMPQTREHLAICELLSINSGIVAITKCDLVDDEIADLVELEVRDLLAGSELANVPIVRTSVETRDGLDELKDQLAGILGSFSSRPQDGLARMPVDRVFTVHGFGTVVTGTLLSGRINIGDKLELLPRGTAVTVRGLQVYGETVESAVAGQRTAVNLQGLDTNAVERGDLLVTPNALSATYMIDARLHMLSDHSLEQLQRVRFHHGATEILCRVAILESEEVGAGSSELVQLRLETPYACAPGDQFVVRRYSPMLTIGGGTVLDNLPSKHRPGDSTTIELLRRLEGGTLKDRVALLTAASGSRGAEEVHLQHRTFSNSTHLRSVANSLADAGCLAIAQETPLIVLDSEVVNTLEETIIEAVRRQHAEHPLMPGLSKSAVAATLPRHLPEVILDALLDRLITAQRLDGGSNTLALPEHNVTLSEPQEHIRTTLLTTYEEGGWSPPSIDNAWKQLRVTQDDGEEVFQLLLRQGELVRLREDLIFSAARLDALVHEVRT
ncbi:MAG: selenocysteine-specific translation elongation factor, partial [Acidobacteriota bacterium]|nr:selenocysteine-specific translation elongation factor [Acidobacteriota bacterium]